MINENKGRVSIVVKEAENIHFVSQLCWEAKLDFVAELLHYPGQRLSESDPVVESCPGCLSLALDLAPRYLWFRGRVGQGNDPSVIGEAVPSSVSS
jgi:hypothetical protein